MDKQSMIKYMEDNGLSMDNILEFNGVGGWEFVWGHYEPYLNNPNVGQSIYEHELWYADKR